MGGNDKKVILQNAFSGYDIDTEEPFELNKITERLEKLLEKAQQVKDASLAGSPHLDHEADPSGSIEENIGNYLKLNSDVFKYSFSPRQCESLLNGTLDLIQRCVAEKAGYDALREAWQDRWFVLEELRRLSEIASSELMDGSAELVGLEAEAASLVHLINAEAADIRRTTIDNNLQNDCLNETVVGQKAVAAVAGDNAIDSARTLAAFEIRRQRFGLELSMNETATQFKKLDGDLANNRSERIQHILNTKLQYEKQTARSSYKARLVLMTDLLAAKLLAFQGKGQPHNYLEQLDAIRNRFARDMLEMHARIEAASLGLQEIYGIYDSPPSVDELINNDGSFLESYSAYARNAVRAVNAIMAAEQVAEFCVYVPYQKNDRSRTHFGVAGNEFEFSFPADMFNATRYARVKNVQAIVDEKVPCRGVYMLGIKSPVAGVFRHQNGVAGTSKLTPTGRLVGDDAFPWLKSPGVNFDRPEEVFSQNPLTMFSIGRVGTRSSTQAPFRFMNGELINISPFGKGGAKWTLFIPEMSSFNESSSDVLNGIELQFTVAFREV